MKSAKTNPSFKPASEEAGFFMKKVLDNQHQKVIQKISVDGLAI